ncbi:hypothetical protein FNV43_RR21656 [Rhamnella rubrinervis]|uniref:Uncharacterized protein n=1 Tax=Rhamnella rubrinervis TaxID=2594499 RepID=A0A8K0DQ32_9ROSA|nr:hypothetical protein FNV43_RR21656 [Rhamnella rubrinervis]
MVEKIVCSHIKVSDVESHFEPPKKGSKDDPIIVNNSEEVGQENKLEDNKCKWDATFDAMLDEEQHILVWEYVCKFKDALLFEEGEHLPSEEDYKKTLTLSDVHHLILSFKDSDVDEDEDP